MKKIITFAEQDIRTIVGLLNTVTVTGIQNCRQIAVISQILESGMSGEIRADPDESEKREGEG